MFAQDMGNPQVAIVHDTISTEAGYLDLNFFNSVAKLPGLTHHLSHGGEASAFCDRDDAFTLENNSKWVTPDPEAVNNWRPDDDLYLTQNQAVFSLYRFAIVNPRLQKAVPISLLREPLPFEDTMFFISAIDFANDAVTLRSTTGENSIEWTVYPHDHGTLQRFRENDRVMLGINSLDITNTASPGVFKSYIIINTASNLYVRANPSEN